MIYIVEDDASIRELEQYALQSSGYDVKSFEEPGGVLAGHADHRARAGDPGCDAAPARTAFPS